MLGRGLQVSVADATFFVMLVLFFESFFFFEVTLSIKYIGLSDDIISIY